MALLGTLVNAGAIVAGALIGLFLSKMREQMSDTIMQAIGIVVLVIGLSMALETDNFVTLLLSVVFGGIIGSWLKLEERLQLWKTSGTKIFRANVRLSRVSYRERCCIVSVPWLLWARQQRVARRSSSFVHESAVRRFYCRYFFSHTGYRCHIRSCTGFSLSGKHRPRRRVDHVVYSGKIC